MLTPGEVNMNQGKVIPFPAPVPIEQRPEAGRRRLILEVGNQRWALDIDCKVTELTPRPEMKEGGVCRTAPAGASNSARSRSLADPVLR